MVVLTLKAIKAPPKVQYYFNTFVWTLPFLDSEALNFNDDNQVIHN